MNTIFFTQQMFANFTNFFFREIDLNLFFLEYNPLTGDTGSTTSSSGIANRYKGRGGGG